MRRRQGGLKGGLQDRVVAAECQRCDQSSGTRVPLPRERQRVGDDVRAAAPLLPVPLDVLDTAGDVIHHGETVSVDLTLSLEETWHETRGTAETSCRLSS